MQINLSGHHVDITEALRENVTTKMTKLSRHFDHINNVHVVLTVEKSNQIAEATVHVSGSDLHAKAENADMYASIDSLVVKLDRQILKYKGKTNQH
ncbi:MAG: putative sigma-54 modulation protein [Colwellia sp.]|jgi:putative sigma-54 modulation protein|uniref:ribosome hibernation-promoting factor, HPF/YfiA family n=1 Tax=unclassified Colwellia TaxID=196834 RepID=UPI0015F401CA|nr:MULTISPECIES: ribosome-associated translation inhibitor RaiA [unclassified Colwellia]MBA6254121.1 ribosome-associated translation inhibitor RaiA [Colwellia sp. MB3u-55]MBA6396164.1 ribosome-associated translation inhibitor RaiA [Colwellia sp. BRX10-4]